MRIDGNSKSDISGFPYNVDYAWKEWAEMFKSHIAKELFWYVCDPPSNGSDQGITVFDGLDLKKDYIQIHKGIWEGNVSTAHPCYNTISFTQIADKRIIDEQGNERHLMLSPNAKQNSWLWENAIREGDWQFIDIPIYDLEENYTEEEQEEYDEENKSKKEEIQVKEQELKELKEQLEEAKNEYLDKKQLIEDIVAGTEERFDKDWIGGDYETYSEPQERIQTSWLFWQMKNARLFIETGEISISDYYTYFKTNGEYREPDQDERATLEDYVGYQEDVWDELTTELPKYIELEEKYNSLKDEVSQKEDELKLLKASLTPTREISHWRLWNTFLGQWNAKNKNEQPVMDWKFTKEEMPMWAFNQMFKNNFSQDTSIVDVSNSIQSSIPMDMWSVSSIPYRYIPKEVEEQDGELFIKEFATKVNDFFALKDYYYVGAQEIDVFPDLSKKPQYIEDQLVDSFKDTGLTHYDHILASGMGIRELGWVDFLYPSQAYGGVFDWNHYTWLYPLTQWGEPKPPVQVLYTNQLVLGHLLWLNYRNWMNTALKLDSKFKVAASRIATLEMNYPIVHKFSCEKSKHIKFSLEISSEFPEGKKKEDYVTPEQEAAFSEIYYYKYVIEEDGYVKPEKKEGEEGEEEPEPDTEFLSYNQMINTRDYTPQEVGHIEAKKPENGDVLTVGNFLGKVGIGVTIDKDGAISIEQTGEQGTDEKMDEAWGKISTLMSLQSPRDQMREKIQDLEKMITDLEYEQSLYQERWNSKDLRQQEWQQRMETLAQEVQSVQDEIYNRQYGINDQDYDLFCLNFLEQMYPELVRSIRDLMIRIDYAKEHKDERFDELKRQAMTDYVWTPAYDYINQNYGFTSTYDDPEQKMYDVESQFFSSPFISEDAKSNYNSYKENLLANAPSDQDIQHMAEKEIEDLEQLLNGFVWDGMKYTYDPTSEGARYQELKRQYNTELQEIFTHCDSIILRLKKELKALQDLFVEAQNNAESYGVELEEIMAHIQEISVRIQELEEEIRKLEEKDFDQRWLPNNFFCTDLFAEVEEGQPEQEFTSFSQSWVGYNLKYVYPVCLGTSYKELVDAGVDEDVLTEVHREKKWIVDSDFPSKKFKDCFHIQDNWLWKKYLLNIPFKVDDKKEGQK